MLNKCFWGAVSQLLNVSKSGSSNLGSSSVLTFFCANLYLGSRFAYWHIHSVLPCFQHNR